MMTARFVSSLSFIAAGLGLVFGCTVEPGSAALGGPCVSDEDCDGDLICDVHGDQGTCQQDHGHGDGDGDTSGETHGDTEGDVDCASETRDDEYAVGLSKSGAEVTATFVLADPAPPAMGDNTWVLVFTDAEGVPVDELEIVVTPTMPDHGHGSPVEAMVTATENPGEYSLAPINLFMAGYWEVALDVSKGDLQDSISFGFCVE